MSANGTEQILNCSAAEIAHRTTAGELSAREVVEAHITRVEQTHAQLNAVVVPLFDQARRQAGALDRRRSQGEPLGRLHGVPVTIKEMYDVTGTPTTVGIMHRRDQLVSEDADLVARLREAGAVILGKTNVPQLGLAIESDNPVYGRTCNPWQLDRSPGGSSGGEAAILAARGSALGLGSDGGGSIRQPAHSCGICGLKPTSGRLTMRGHWNFLGFPQGFSQGGPMARTVEDVELALEVLCDSAPGSDAAEVCPVELGKGRDVQLHQIRIGVYSDDGYISAAPAIRRAVEEASQAMASLGATVERFEPPDVGEAWAIFFGLCYADGNRHAYRELTGSPKDWRVSQNLMLARIANPLRPVAYHLLRRVGQVHLAEAFEFTRKRSLSAAEHQDLWERLRRYRSTFMAALNAARLDALICPPNAVPAVKHDSRYAAYSVLYTLLYNLLGMPAGVVPATKVSSREESDRTTGRDLVLKDLQNIERGSSGLPVGVQVVARHWREDIALAVMSALEQHFRAREDFPARPQLAAQRV